MRYFLVILLTILISGGCSYEAAIEAEGIKANPHLKEEIFSTIINDEELLSDFMSRAMNEPAAMQEAMMNEEMMQQMYSQQTMQNMMQQNPEMMNKMMNNMMQMSRQDSSFRNMMRNNENWQPMMDMMQEDGHMMHN